MPVYSLVLVLIAAFAHSTWNLLAKRAASARHLIWFSSLGEAVLLLPAALWILHDPDIRLGGRAIVALVMTGLLHLLYAECLIRGYRTGDLSVVYPVARGTGPLLSFVGAVFVLGERVSFVACVGAICVVVGIFALAGVGGREWHMRLSAIGWGAITGITIAAYTLVDGYAVRRLQLSPVLIEYAGNLFRMLILTIVALRARDGLATEYRQYWREARGISILTPAGYVLVLLAMRQASVSHVAPAREISMVIGAWLGTRFLGEPDPVRRLGGAALIGVGIAALVAG